MEPVRDAEKVKRMFLQGQTTIVDPESKYKYSMVARCPKDGSYASVSQIQRSGQALSRVIFECTSCFSQFEVNQDEIFVR
jgi:hypothetical protein